MNNDDVQYINDISYGYWKAQALFVASELKEGGQISP